MSTLLDNPQVQKALAAVDAGALGQVASVDIVCSSAYPPYEGGPLPPWYRDAGYPFRDLGAHALAVMQALLGPIEDVDAEWSSLGGESNLVFDEWRAKVTCTRGVGELQLSNSKSQLVIHGSKRVLRVDLSGKRAPRRLVDAFAHVWKRVRPDAAPGEPPPVDAQVAHWVDKVANAAEADHRARLAPLTLSDRVPFLVTGASGSLGQATVKRLLADGHKIRLFQRRRPTHPQPGIEYAIGNLGDPEAVDRAVRGAEIVLHCGAAMKGPWIDHKGGTIIGTQNVIAACKTYDVKQLVYISSMSVIDCAGSAGNGPVSEAANLEPRPTERGDYTRAKLEAERLITDAAGKGLPVVILRPGQIFGGGIPLINGAVARNAGGRWLVLGDGKLELPLVYIDDVVDAMLASIHKQLTHGEIIQIIDPEHLTQEDVLGLAGGTRPILRLPRPFVFALGKLSELPLGALGRQSPVAAYRLRSALARLHYESDRASQLLGWTPRVGVREGIKRVQPDT